MTRSCVRSLALAIAFAALPAHAWAIDLNQWVQGLKFQPFVTERLEYQTNVQQTKAHTSDDLISRTIPGFQLRYDRGGVLFGTGYRAEILKFYDRSDLDNLHHIAFGELRLTSPRFRFDVRSDFVLTSDPPTTEIPTRIDSTTISVDPAEFQYQVTPRLGLGVVGAFKRVDFEHRVRAISRQEYLVGGFVAWKIVPKADLRFGYAYSWKDFLNNKGNIDTETVLSARNRDVSSRQLFTIGVRGELTPKLTSTFTAGYEIRDQRDPKLDDLSTYVVSGDWVYRPTDRTKLSLVTSRSFEESIFGQTGNTVLFESTTATFLAEQRIGSKLRVNARVGGVLNQYPVKEFTSLDPSAHDTSHLKFRVDEILSYGAGVDYDLLKWLLLGAEYAHVARDSTFKEFQYKDDKFTAKLTVQF